MNIVDEEGDTGMQGVFPAHFFQESDGFLVVCGELSVVLEYLREFFTHLGRKLIPIQK